MACRPPVLLGLVEVAGDFGVPIEGEDARQRFAIDVAAVPAFVDRVLEDLDDLGGEESRCGNAVRKDMDVGSSAGDVIGAASVRIRVDIKR